MIIYEDSLTRMVLVNALYFKGDWLCKFNRSNTEQRPIYLGSESNKVDALMKCMTARFRIANIEGLDAKILELPYGVHHIPLFINILVIVYTFLQKKNMTGQAVEHVYYDAKQNRCSNRFRSEGCIRNLWESGLNY